MDINLAMTMITQFQERAYTAEYEMRALRRFFKRWKAKSGEIANRDENTSVLTVTLEMECTPEEAVDLLQKLGSRQSKLDAK